MSSTALRDQSLIDGLPCGWLRLDPRGTIVLANARLAQLCGQAGPPVGRILDELLTLPSRVVFQSHLAPLLRFGGNTSELSLALNQPDGAPPLDVLLYTSCVAGLPGHIDVVVAPIRQRRRIEDELVRVKRAADQAPLMVFQLISRGGQPQHFAYASQTVRQLYGCTPEAAAVSAQTVLDRLEPEAAAALCAALHTAALERRDCHIHYTLRRAADAPPRTHEFVATPRAMADGRTMWHGYVADITERLRLEGEAAERTATRQAEQLRRDFLARASHELRTPLNAILGFAQLLGQGDPGQLRPQQQRALTTLQTAGRHMLALVNQLLDLSRAERESGAVVLQPLPLAPELAAAIEGWQGPAMMQSQTLSVQLPPALAEASVLADPVSLRQVLANLLSNAVKYTPPGGRIVIEAQPAAEGRLRLVVADNGPGLDAAQRAHLFEPFNRLGAERGPTEGSGLGLVVSRQLVQALGGELELDDTGGSGSGSGCRFGFELALAESAARTDGERLPSEPLPADAWPAKAAPSAAHARRGLVLYVEDNEINTMLMQAIVALRPGVDLRLAGSGHEAEHLVDSGGLRPDLLLLDLHLPDLDGRELLRRLRQRPALASVPALLVTATTGDDAYAGSSDFQGFWFKPLDLHHTLAELDRFLA